MHTKTTSQASKTGWLANKLKSLQYLLSYKPTHEEYNTGALGSLVVPSDADNKKLNPHYGRSPFAVNITTPTKLERYVGVTGKIFIHITEDFYAVGGDGMPVLSTSTSLRNDKAWKECLVCGLFMRPVDYYRHIGQVDSNEIVTRTERIPAIPLCTKIYKDISSGKAVLVDGVYREVFKRVPKMTSFKPEDANELVTDVDDLEPDGKYKGLYLIPGHICSYCKAGKGITGVCYTSERPKRGYETMDELGRTMRVIGTDEQLVEVGQATSLTKSLDKPVAMIRFVRDSHNGTPNKYFSVELNGKLRRFSVVEDYESDFHPMFRFAPGITEHRLCYNEQCVALVSIEDSINHDGNLVRASNTNGELNEFFLPHTHEFFKYVVVEATVAEIMQ